MMRRFWRRLRWIVAVGWRRRTVDPTHEKCGACGKIDALWIGWCWECELKDFWCRQPTRSPSERLVAHANKTLR